MRPLLPALVACAVALAPALAPAAEETPAPPRIYRWVDENGVAHYTTDEDRIPSSLRRRFGLPTQPLEREPLDAGAPEVPPVPRAEPPATRDAWVSQERSETPPVDAAPPAPGAETSLPPGAEASLPPVAANAADDAERLAQIELRIAELSAAIAADEDALSAWIGDPAGGDAVEVGQKPEFREIAKRLPKRIQELEALRRERDALVGTP
jgi:hypothetical protein